MMRSGRRRIARFISVESLQASILDLGFRQRSRAQCDAGFRLALELHHGRASLLVYLEALHVYLVHARLAVVVVRDDVIAGVNLLDGQLLDREPTRLRR